MDIVEFLTSKEIIVVYIVAAVACLLCFIIYLVEKHNDRGRKKHNTKELNKLVEQIKEEVEIVPDEEDTEPVLQVIEESNPAVEEVQEDSLTDEDIREVIREISTEAIQEMSTEDIKKAIEEEPIEILSMDEDIQYTSIEPDVEKAKEELHKITEVLKEQEEKVEEVIENSALTSYEVEQEENAIISLEELVKKSKELYESNELTQYEDEGNEPISIADLEVISGREVEPVTSPFVITKAVDVEEENVLDNAEVKEVKKFKNSPIISPIFGIEKKDIDVNEQIELENTANYEKLDAEIKKTNEFLMTLKELQSKLD